MRSKGEVEGGWCEGKRKRRSLKEEEFYGGGKREEIQGGNRRRWMIRKGSMVHANEVIFGITEDDAIQVIHGNRLGIKRDRASNAIEIKGDDVSSSL